MKKIDKVEVVKIAGWLTAAVAGIMVSWASDKQTKKQNDENFQKYISEKNNNEEDELRSFLFFYFKTLFNRKEKTQ